MEAWFSLDSPRVWVFWCQIRHRFQLCCFWGLCDRMVVPGVGGSSVGAWLSSSASLCILVGTWYVWGFANKAAKPSWWHSELLGKKQMHKVNDKSYLFFLEFKQKFGSWWTAVCIRGGQYRPVTAASALTAVFKS